MPSFKETANAKFKSLREKLKRRGRKAERVFKIIGLSGILSVSSLATQEANAQTRDGNQPITEFRMTDGKLIPVRSPQQTAQEIRKNLPAYTRALVDEQGLEIIPELQGGRTTGLNRPAAGVVYACVTWAKDEYGNHILNEKGERMVQILPVAEGIETPNTRNFITLNVIDCSYEQAYEMMRHPTNHYVKGMENPYKAYSEYANTTDNRLDMAQKKRNQLQRKIDGVQQTINQGRQVYGIIQQGVNMAKGRGW
ncbi:MAG: hypothetical protein Q4D11_00670 [Rhodospirillales bacterium]|nr:hypothetical protein [Rhodospirillales bacterium]